MNNFYAIDKDIQGYVEDVLSGKEVAGEMIFLACKRFRDWFDRDDFWFDNDKVNKVIDFILHLKHFEDEWAGRPFILMPWQKWVIANIFGWYRESDHSKRVIRNVFLLISRKNGKTALSAAIMLAAMVIDGVAGAECYLLANSKDLSKICYKFIDGFANSIDKKSKHFKRYRDYLLYPKTKSKMKCLSSDTMSQDGMNPSIFIVDEYHAAPDSGNYDVMKSGLAARKNPLAIIISSAGTLLDGYPCYESVKVGREILRGIKQDDSWFYALYQLDPEDDWQDEAVWKKACPNYGITVYEDYMHERILEAKNDTMKTADVKTKNLNMFILSMQAWLPTDIVDKAMQYRIDMKQLEGEDCYVGVDLSSVRDLTSVSLLFPPNENREYFPDKYIFKSILYIPLVALKESPNRNMYELFHRNGEAVVTSGAAVDYDIPLKNLLEVDKHVLINKVSYDLWNAKLFNKQAEEEGLPMEAYGLGLGNFNIPTKTFEVLIREGKLLIDKSTAVKWCINNVELKIDHMDNCKPIKAGDDQNKKIDCCISMLEALGGYLLDKEYYFGT